MTGKIPYICFFRIDTSLTRGEMAEKYDVIIAWTSMHGGTWHKLIRLHEVLGEAGLKSRLLVNADAPMGLQKGIDYEEKHRLTLAEADVHILPFDQMYDAMLDVPASLYVFGSFESEFTKKLVAAAKAIPNAKTAQLCALLADFSSYGTDYLLAQHPMTFYFEIDYTRSRWRHRLKQARSIIYAGNIFFEPVDNIWTSDIRGWDGLCDKYGFDPNLPLGLWLPDRSDGLDDSYEKVVDAIRAVPMNAAVKMHPWEYKNLCHGGPDDIYCGKTSAEQWDVTAIEEKDSALAFKHCAFGVTRGSSVGIELAVLRKPSIFIPHDTMQYWPDLYHAMTRRCSFMMDSVNSLSPFLRETYPFDLKEEDYTSSFHHFLTSRHDAFSLHVEAFKKIIESPRPAKEIGSLSSFRKEYLGKLPFEYLKRRHYPEHALWKGLRRLREES